jgi:hypothetical protein
MPETALFEHRGEEETRRRRPEERMPAPAGRHGGLNSVFSFG